MNAQSRRNAIMEVLKAEEKPVSASTLAKQFNVSRQIIVGDIALLRAGGADISATPKGYVLAREREGLVRSIVCKHSGMEEMAQELNICVDHGCCVLDVIVEHPVYGQLAGQLHLVGQLLPGPEPLFHRDPAVQRLSRLLIVKNGPRKIPEEETHED